jgi:hypothetical protein
MQRENKIRIWSSGFHQATIRDASDYESRRRYIRMNPVEANLLAGPEDWAYRSAFGRFALDPMPRRMSSGAKARSAVGRNVGAEAPTP